MTQRVLEWVNSRLASGQKVATAVVVETSGSVPGKVGARIALTTNEITGTVGGAGLELKVIDELRNLLSEGGGKVLTYGLNKGARGHEVVPLDSLCGGRVVLSLEVIKPMPHVLLMGGGHVAQAIARQCEALGWDHSVQDTRSEYASAELYPQARELYPSTVAEFLGTIGDAARFSDVLLLGHDWKEDEERLLGLLAMDVDAMRIGVIGSRSKWQAFEQKALETGVSQSRLDMVDCPIGLDIGAESPEEIAVAVVGSILARMKGVDPRAGNWRVNP